MPSSFIGNVRRANGVPYESRRPPRGPSTRRFVALLRRLSSPIRSITTFSHSYLAFSNYA